ncbi:hypothetical protein XarbCFBP8152_20205 [Xanthomonas arboricola]|nr:hypothetical protein XarbCFBP8152_20205 [Xanthomonas arboricola]
MDEGWGLAVLQEECFNHTVVMRHISSAAAITCISRIDEWIGHHAPVRSRQWACLVCLTQCIEDCGALQCMLYTTFDVIRLLVTFDDLVGEHAIDSCLYVVDAL